MVVGKSNNFVQVIVDLSSSSVICKFINQEANHLKSCTITYGPGENCDNLSNHGLRSDTTSTSDSVVIHLPGLAQARGMVYCYTITASNGTFTAMVMGAFSTGIL